MQSQKIRFEGSGAILHRVSIRLTDYFADTQGATNAEEKLQGAVSLQLYPDNLLCMYLNNSPARIEKV
jgi:hypothetical protein